MIRAVRSRQDGGFRFDADSHAAFNGEDTACSISRSTA